MKFAVDVCSEAIVNNMKIEDLLTFFNDQIYITNYLEVRYDHYSVCLGDELKAYKFHEN